MAGTYRYNPACQCPWCANHGTPPTGTPHNGHSFGYTNPHQPPHERWPPMRIIAALSWYDEHPAHLERLTTSLHHAGINLLTAVDGPYALYPHQHPRSNQAQYNALRSTRLRTITHSPNQAWAGNEIAKRNHLFQLAHAHATPGNDWLLITDADMWLTNTTPGQLHEQLEQTTHDVAALVLQGDGDTRWHRCLFRTQPEPIQVVGHHANYQTADGRILWNPVHLSQQEPALQITGPVLEHAPHERDEQRNQARLNYYDRARDERIETLT